MERNRAYRPPMGDRGFFQRVQHQRPSGRGRGFMRGRGRGGEGEPGSWGDRRGARSMESLSVQGGWRQDSDAQDNWRQRAGGQEGWRQRPGHRGYGPRGGFRGNSRNAAAGPESDESRSSGHRRRQYPISVRDLDMLTTLKPDVVVLELLSERSGFPLLVEQSDIPAFKLHLAIKALALAVTSQSMQESVYKLLIKTYTEGFVAKLIIHSLTVKREFTDKGTEFFTDLVAVLETFCDGMISIAIIRLVNLVDICHTTLTTMEAEGHVENDLVNRYRTLLDRLNEAAKKWEREKNLDKQDMKKKRLAELDDMKPPDDFRDIPVLPTPLDIVESKRIFLRRNVVQGRYVDGEHYLDVQFRLLREDFVRPLREGIGQFRSNTKSRIMDVRIYRNVTYVGSKLQHQRIFHEVRLGSLKKMRLENSKRLMYGNLVCFSNDNFATMILGSVADRSPDSLKEGIIGIEFESDIGELDMSGNFVMVESRAYFMAYKHVLQALKEMRDDIPMEKYVVQVEHFVEPPRYLQHDTVYDMRVIKNKTLMKKSEAFSAFCWTRMDEEPEEPEEVPQEISNLEGVHVAGDLADWPSADELGLDDSQRRALHSALTRELAIIQGPPGTGKTFIGLKIVQTLLHNSEAWKDKENPTPILVVCFTNHALDQFLEGMMTFTNSIVRVGSRTQSESIAKYQINRLVQSASTSRFMQRSFCDEKLQVSQELLQLEDEIGFCQQIDRECDAARGIFTLDVFTSQNVIPDHIVKQFDQVQHEEKLTHWLTFNYRQQPQSGLGREAVGSAAQKQMVSRQRARVEEEGELDEDERKDTEEFLQTEEKDRRIEDDLEEPLCHARIEPVRFEVTKGKLDFELTALRHMLNERDDEYSYLQYIIYMGQLEALNYGLCIPVNRQEMEALEGQTALKIWELEAQKKWQLYNHWVAKLQEKVRPTWRRLGANYQRRVKAMEEMKNAQYLHVMRRAAVVGMTTTGAAQYSKILQDLAPAVVVIEEAAEILESHVITSLSGGCRHLILIGDHQQLQPSATVYELATKYGLETSLFERLIKNGLAFETLEYQHRMRPSISRLLVPSIYPSLKDHPSVQGYPRVQGLTRSVFFVTHQELEKEESDDNNSHENQHEAELLMGLCSHLMLQGYQPDEVTILTVYSGQFFLLKKLQRQNPICAGVRICVVDNFQGEENNIILLSLVRSNPEGKVGFLRTENRVCVALSRAKHGLYVTGNMELLAQSSKLWKKIKEDLSESGSLGEALTLRCQNHPHQLSVVSKGQDFQAKSPEGGCLLMCATPLRKCRHSCKRVCHTDDLDHKAYKCTVPCPKILCSLDHKCPKACWEKCGLCMVIMTRDLPCGHVHDIACHVDPNVYECPTAVMKAIPACQHEASMPCHQDPAHFTCPHDCDTRVRCGHKCRMRCHRTKDPDHLTYLCKEQCTKINVGCSQNHLCLRKCYQECGSCVVLVDKTLPCGHEAKGVECAMPVEEIQCNKKCKTTLPCGHACRQLCYKKCGDCTVPVKKVVPACNHTITVSCSQPVSSELCDGPCPKLLPCGHPCRAKCREKCTARCPELVTTANECPRKHAIKLPCHLQSTVQGEAAWEYCSESCNKTLDCEHPCGGTCGRCLHGRLHQACSHPCRRSLVCGHICKYPCGVSCPPCQEQCQWKCVHSKCRMDCGKPCEPCKEKCEWKCKHMKCTRKCGYSCSRKPCDKPCPKKLQCGHDCVGFCGDPCPPLCRVCDSAELTDFVLLGNEEEPDARFVLLEDCGHCIEVKGLEGWLMQDTSHVGMKTCPKCRKAIYNNRRYQHLVLEAYKAVQAIKKKYYRTHDTIKTRDIELILQDPQVISIYRPEIVTILKKILPQGRQRQPYEISVEEKALRHFQAQVLSKASSILKLPQDTMPRTLALARQSQAPLSKHQTALKPKVADLVKKVMAQTTTISQQMKEEVTCELQRLAMLPSYWTLQERCSAHQHVELVTIKAELEEAMNPTARFDEGRDRKVRALLKKSEQYVGGLGISNEEKVMILEAMKLQQGHWYKCPNGHIYCITECGGAMEQSTCPECGRAIGGSSHTLLSDNTVASEMDGAQHPAWSEHNNMANFDLGNL